MIWFLSKSLELGVMNSWYFSWCYGYLCDDDEMNDQKPFIDLTPLSSAVKNKLSSWTNWKSCLFVKVKTVIRKSCLFLVNKCSYLHDFLRALIIWSNVGHSFEKLLITVENIFHVFTAWIENWQFQCQSFTFWQNHLTRC